MECILSLQEDLPLHQILNKKEMLNGKPNQKKNHTNINK